MTTDAIDRSTAMIVGGPPRKSAPITLQWPVSFMGRNYTSIIVRRLSTAEVGAFAKAIGSDGEARLPMFEDESGSQIPPEVLDAMDHDDTAAVTKVAEEWLPLALKGVLTSGSPSATGAG